MENFLEEQPTTKPPIEEYDIGHTIGFIFFASLIFAVFIYMYGTIKNKNLYPILVFLLSIIALTLLAILTLISQISL